jgi:hypothetical protein
MIRVKGKILRLKMTILKTGIKIQKDTDAATI